jgi:hypothetical protein
MFAIDIDEVRREDCAYMKLSALGLGLMRSGTKPGTDSQAYRVITQDRMTIGQIEKFIKVQQLITKLPGMLDGLLLEAAD